MVRRHHKLRIGWFHQHLTEQLDLDLTPIQFMQKQFPAETEVEAVRRIIGTIPLKLAVTNTVPQDVTVLLERTKLCLSLHFLMV